MGGEEVESCVLVFRGVARVSRTWRFGEELQLEFGFFSGRSRGTGDTRWK